MSYWSSVLSAVVVVAALAFPAAPATAQAFPPRLSPSQAEEVRATIDSMRRDPRGPYLRIRWFCADGTVQPPQGSPCRDRGGGVQYAEYNDRATRLAQLDVHVGTILQATSFAALFDSARAGYRLREQVVARHIEEVDDGWALRRARYYRGARQIEDEERSGTAILQELLTRPAWTSRHFLLAYQLVGTLPHVGVAGDQRTQLIRNLATEIAVLDSAFLDIRVKIHSFPSRSDLDAVERFGRARTRTPAVQTKLRELATALREQYDERATLDMFAQYRRGLSGPVVDRVRSVEAALRSGSREDGLAQLGALAVAIRDEVSRSRDGRRNLVLLGLAHAAQEQAFVLAQAPAVTGNRLARLNQLEHYFALAYGAGLLTARERGALAEEIGRLRIAPTLTALDYRQHLRYLARSVEWAAATVRAVYGPVYERYAQFELKAMGFQDATIRGSVLLPLAQALDALLADADRMLGTSHIVLGRAVSQGIRGLNPGVALRVLEVAHDERAGASADATKIYVLPETTPELRPVAGVLTLGEGNLLSHVQLLARNLGIPNAAVSTALLSVLETARGDSVFYAVSPLGRVLVKRSAELTAEERQLVERGRAVGTERYQLDTRRLRLDRTAPIPLQELRLEHSGVVVGPKAANLGQLAAFFPTRVSKGLALPFGMFYTHVNRRFESERTALEDLRNAYVEAGRMRARGVDEATIDRFVFDALARMRRAIMELEWLPQTRDAVIQAMRETFDDDLSGGLFVRSDTNVEDLPQFSGAGLNLTVPHQRTVDGILNSIKRVWTSPFSERAYLWRKQILDEQAQIYPSVLLLESVHSEKSGVLISSGLQFGRATDLTIATAEGVGGAVEGEEAETIVVGNDGVVRLLTQAKAPQRRVLLNTGEGGSQMVAAQLPDTLLRPDEISQLQAMVAQWKRRVRDADPGT
ncbi:MAG: hypothetical protein OER90_12080, partial [Gemmatimonadota bacterium]|nr:hypothetical protein [Gemmatimonadota bacterium]